MHGRQLHLLAGVARLGGGIARPHDQAVVAPRAVVVDVEVHGEAIAGRVTGHLLHQQVDRLDGLPVTADEHRRGAVVHHQLDLVVLALLHLRPADEAAPDHEPGGHLLQQRGHVGRIPGAERLHSLAGLDVHGEDLVLVGRGRRRGRCGVGRRTVRARRPLAIAPLTRRRLASRRLAGSLVASGGAGILPVRLDRARGRLLAGGRRGRRLLAILTTITIAIAVVGLIPAAAAGFPVAGAGGHGVVLLLPAAARATTTAPTILAIVAAAIVVLAALGTARGTSLLLLFLGLAAVAVVPATTPSPATAAAGTAPPLLAILAVVEADALAAGRAAAAARPAATARSGRAAAAATAAATVRIAIPAVSLPATTARLLLHPHHGLPPAEAEQAAALALQDGDVDFLAAQAHPQQCLADGLVHGLARALHGFAHDVC